MALNVMVEILIAIALLICVAGLWLFLRPNRKPQRASEDGRAVEQSSIVFYDDDVPSDTPAQAALRKKYRPLLLNVREERKAEHIVYQCLKDGVVSGMNMNELINFVFGDEDSIFQHPIIIKHESASVMVDFTETIDVGALYRDAGIDFMRDFYIDERTGKPESIRP